MRTRERHTVRCFSTDGTCWVHPVDMDTFTGETARQDAIRRMRELALDMRDTMAKRFEEPFTVTEFALYPVAEVERVSDGKAHVRYEVIDSGRIVDFQARKRW